MPTEKQAEVEPAKKPGALRGLAIWFLVVTVSVGGGFATPLVVAKLSAGPASGSGATTPQLDPNEEVEYIDFDEIVAVLGKSKFSRYLKLSISLQVPKSQRLTVEKRIAARNAVLRNRIIAHIAEITEEDLAGQHGHNLLRRNILSYFNEILFDDGIERIQDVLFREFQVQ